MQKIALIALLVWGSVSAATLEEQIKAQPEGTWFQVAANNKAEDVDPEKGTAGLPYHGATGYRAIWAAWNGGAFASDLGTCGSMLYYGGGHADYYGSEVIQFDICGLRWSRLSDPYPNPVFPYANGTYPDGSPSPPHTESAVNYIPDTHEFVVLLGQKAIAPVWVPGVWLFNVQTKKWRGPYSQTGAQSGFSAWDSGNKLLFWQAYSGKPEAERRFQSFNPVTNKVSEYQASVDSQLSNGGTLMGYDPDAKVLTTLNIYINSVYNWTQIAERDPATPAVNWKRAKVVNWPAELSGQGTMRWSPTNQAWIVWMDLKKNGQVFKLKRTVVAGEPTYTWTLLTSTANTNVLIGEIGWGSYNKFGLTQVGNYEILIGQTDLAHGVWAFKLPGIITTPPSPVPTPLPGEAVPASCLPILPDYQALPFCPVSASYPVYNNTVVNVPGGCPVADAIVCETFTGGVEGTLTQGSVGKPYIDQGELVLDLPSKSGSSPNGGLLETFTPLKDGDFLAFSYKIKVDKATAEGTWPGRKEWIVDASPGGCVGQSLVQSHYTERPTLLAPYAACGGVGFAYTNPDGTGQMQGWPGGAIDCTYAAKGLNDLSKCAVTVPDIWQTYYVEMKIGHYGQPDSTVNMWQKNGAGIWKQYVRTTTHVFETGNGFDRLGLDAYMTGRDVTIAYPVGQVRFDDLIIARRPFMAEIGG